MEDEALEAERFEADTEMAELTRAGSAMHRAQRAGICTHGSSVGYCRPVYYPEQAGLKPGQSRCTEGTGGCDRVFTSDQDWYDAMAEAVS